MNYSDAHYTLYREGATLYTIHRILYSIQGRCHTIIIHYTGRVPRGSACSQGGRRVASSGGFLLAERWPTLSLSSLTALSSSTPPQCSLWRASLLRWFARSLFCCSSPHSPLLENVFEHFARWFSNTKKKNSQGGSPPNIKSSISPQESFCPESLAASHHRWRSVLASTPITLTIQVLRAFQFSAIFTILQECLASLSLASADERHGVATVARPRPLLLPP